MVTITPLGTVSPYCKLDKKCPGFLLDNGKNRIMIDCGNGATSNMNMKEDLKNLTVIISHLHKDHYGDLLSLAYASYVYHNLGFLEKLVDVYIPNDDIIVEKEFYNDETGLSNQRNVKKNLYDYTLLKNLGEESYLNIIDYSEKNNKLKFNDIKINFKKTKHNLHNYASSIEVDGFKICYSGDTGYDEFLIEFFKDADLLICESTFLRGQTRIGNNHLYAYEAGILAKESNVKKLMLTHFWPELDKKLYLNEAKEIFENTIVAEEGKKLVLKRG